MFFKEYFLEENVDFVAFTSSCCKSFFFFWLLNQFFFFFVRVGKSVKLGVGLSVVIGALIFLTIKTSQKGPVQTSEEPFKTIL